MGVVEDAVAGEQVDVEGVMELVSAYEPCFSDVPYQQVEAWLDHTVQAVKDFKEKGKIFSLASLTCVEYHKNIVLHFRL